MIRKERESGLELLRIFAALGVVFLHFCFPSAYDSLNSAYNSIPHDKLLVLGFLECPSLCAVNVFILMTGYFLSSNMHRSLGKPAGLVFQLIIIKLGLWIIGVITGRFEFTFSEMLFNALPRSYFVSLYIALYFISPYLNIIIQSLSKREWKVFIGITLLFFSIWEFLLDIGGDFSNKDLGPMSMISRWGGQKGLTIVNFSLLYCLGGFLRTNEITIKTKFCFLGGGVMTLLIYGWYILAFVLNIGESDYFFNYYNPLIVFQSVFVFLFFKGLNFKSRIVNELAKAAFTCYLINGVLLSKLGGGGLAVRLSSFQLFVFVIVGAIGTYLISYVLYKLFTLVTNKILHRLDSFEIKYWDCE